MKNLIASHNCAEILPNLLCLINFLDQQLLICVMLKGLKEFVLPYLYFKATPLALSFSACGNESIRLDSPKTDTMLLQTPAPCSQLCAYVCVCVRHG